MNRLRDLLISYQATNHLEKEAISLLEQMIEILVEKHCKDPNMRKNVFNLTLREIYKILPKVNPKIKNLYGFFESYIRLFIIKTIKK